LAFFENKIRPVLVKDCYDCHTEQSGKDKGRRRVDDREALRRGGEVGAAVAEGEPGDRLLRLVTRLEDPDLEMPPRKAKLADAVSADFAAWIAAGAPDPREPGKGAASRGGRAEGWEDHWSYRPPVMVDPPTVADEAWAGTA